MIDLTRLIFCYFLVLSTLPSEHFLVKFAKLASPCSFFDFSSFYFVFTKLEARLFLTRVNLAETC